MSKTTSRLIREYVSQHPGCTPSRALESVGGGPSNAGVIMRLIREREIIAVRGRLYISSVRNVASAVG